MGATDAIFVIEGAPRATAVRVESLMFQAHKFGVVVQSGTESVE